MPNDTKYQNLVVLYTWMPNNTLYVPVGIAISYYMLYYILKVSLFHNAYLQTNGPLKA